MFTSLSATATWGCRRHRPPGGSSRSLSWALSLLSIRHPTASTGFERGNDCPAGASNVQQQGNAGDDQPDANGLARGEALLEHLPRDYLREQDFDQPERAHLRGALHRERKKPHLRGERAHEARRQRWPPCAENGDQI